MQKQEVYANAPVVLTAFEVRHTIAPKITPQSERKIKDILGDSVPLRGQIQSPFLLGSDPEVAPRFMSRDRTIAVTFRTGSLMVETTKYKGWESFLSVIKQALSALEVIDQVDGISRVGLRYIDEIRVPESTDSDTINWAKWIDISLLGPARAGLDAGLSPNTVQGLAAFTFDSDKKLNVRFGNLEGYAVETFGDLKRSTPPFGSYFLLDIDSFWEPSGDIEKYSSADLLKITDILHSPIGTVFEALITEDLRKEVLRNG